MKISVNDEMLFELSEVQKKVICNDIHVDEFDADMKRRINYILMHKYEQCMKRLRAEWEPKLKAEGAESIPCCDDSFAQLIFAREDYKCRKQRDEQAQQGL